MNFGEMQLSVTENTILSNNKCRRRLACHEDESIELQWEFCSLQFVLQSL